MPNGLSGCPVRVGEQVGALGIRDGLVQVPPARHHARQARPAHEAGMQSLPGAHLLHGGAHEDQLVGRQHPLRRPEGELDLAWPELHLERAERQVQRLERAAQGLHHRVERVVTQFCEVLIAGVEQRGQSGAAVSAHRAARDDVAFDLYARGEAQPPLLQLGHLSGQQRARGEGHGAPVREEQVAQQPAGMRRPGQHAEGRGIGQHDHVRRPPQRRVRKGAAAVEHRERGFAREVLHQQRGRGVGAVGQQPGRLRRHQRLAAEHAMRVGEGQPHHLQPITGDARGDLGGQPVLLPPSTGRGGRRTSPTARSGRVG